jgi:hypothetical protein
MYNKNLKIKNKILYLIKKLEKCHILRKNVKLSL